MSGHLSVETRWPATVHVVTAGVGRHRKPWRDGQVQHRRHFGEVCPLAAKKVLVGHRWFAVLMVECIDVGHGQKVYARHLQTEQKPRQTRRQESRRRRARTSIAPPSDEVTTPTATSSTMTSAPTSRSPAIRMISNGEDDCLASIRSTSS